MCTELTRDYTSKDFTLKSGGNTVYQVDCESQFRNMLESFETKEEFEDYCSVFFGYEKVPSKDARPLPNSHIMLRSRDRANGIFPTETARQSIECVFSIHPARGATTAVTTPAIANRCFVEMHTVAMSESTSALYRSKLGSYSVINHRHLEVQSWANLAANRKWF